MLPVDAVYPIAVGLAEGGWVAVLYLLVDAVARVGPALHPIVFGLAAGGCCLAAARIDRLAPSRLTIVVGLLVGGAIAGVVLAAVTGLALGGRSPIGALADDPGAVLVGLAALRGFVRAGALRDAGQAARPFFVGLIGLAAAWIFGGALSEPMRTAFRDAAVVPTLAFVAGSLAATGLARTAYAASDADFDPKTNRTWLVALLGVAAALGLAALPIGQGMERVMAAVIAWPMTLPIVIAAAFVARLLVPSRGGVLRRAGAFTFGPLILLAVLAIISVLLPHNEVGPTLPEGGASGVQGPDPYSPVFGIGLTLAALVIIAAVLVFVARAWRRNADATRGRSGLERRQHDVGRGVTDVGAGLGLGDRLRRLVRRGRPGDAVAAYVAVLRALEPDEELRRDPAETPAAHARRLRQRGVGTLELDLLAADFELARWGGRQLSRAEDRRAVGRWDRLRERFAARSVERPAESPADG
jgi:Domain of unknown function (DUF4129)